MVLSGQSVPSPSRLTVFENRVYWSDGTKQGIMSVDKFLGPESMSMVYKDKSAREPRSVKAVHSLVQKRGNFSGATLNVFENNANIFTNKFFLFFSYQPLWKQ